jgi:hypothetical protein
MTSIDDIKVDDIGYANVHDLSKLIIQYWCVELLAVTQWDV